MKAFVGQMFRLLRCSILVRFIKGPAARRVWLALALVWWWAGPLRAEPPVARRYVIDVWQSEKGLPQNTVTGIAQTPDGYLWLSTLDGLARFDGVNFKMFKAGNTPALGSGRIRFLFPGRHGSFWIATQEGGVIQYKSGRFAPLPLPMSPGNRSAINQVAEDAAGRVWLSTEEGKVIRLAEGHGAIISTNWESSGQTVFQVRANSQGQLWVLSGSGLFQLDGERLVSALPGQPGEYKVHCPSRAGGWWMSAGGQVRLWRAGQWIAATPGPALDLSAVTSGFEDSGGHLWLGSAGQGVFRCDTNGTVRQFSRRDGLSSDFTRSLFEDNEGNVWVGTEGGGLNRLRSPLFAVCGTDQGLSSDRVTGVSEGLGGELWVGTDGYGLNRLGGNTARLASQESEAASLRVSAVLADRQGRVWAGVRYGGVLRYEDGRFTPFFSDLAAAHRSTRCLFEDSRGSVWIGQHNATSLVQVQDEAASTIPLPADLPPVDVRVMAEDATGGLWIGTDGNGLLRWKDGQFTRFTREQGLGSDFVWWLLPEPGGALWIGTYGGGLTRLKDGRAATCTTRHGLVDDVICRIADDDRGNYWFSSNQGIFRASKQELNAFADGARDRIQCVAYDRSDGLPTLECEGGSQSAGCRARDGRLWFPTIRGLVVVNPADVSTNTIPPPVYIDQLVVDGKAFEEERWKLENQPLSEQIQQSSSSARKASSLKVPPGSRRFEFQFTAINFSAPQHLRFRHQLEGVDAEWVDSGGQRVASYHRLPRGAYTFRVQARGREGVWNQNGASLSFVVLPFWWQTWWFAGLFLATFGGAVAWAVGFFLRRRHQRHLRLVRRLHALERERTRIARDIHDDLGSSLTEIGLLGALAVRESTPPLEAREQVARIMDRAQELARKLDETVWAVNPKNDSLARLASYVCHFAKEFLEPTDIRCRLDIASELPEAPLTAEIRHHVFLVVKEALNNTVQHSGATEVWLRLEASEGGFTLEMADNGRGFMAEANREGTGNGLRNMAGRMAEIGAEFMVRSTPGAGATVRLRLPLPPSDVNGARSAAPTQLGEAGRPKNR